MALVSALITRTRELINITDTTSNIITDSEITSWINIWQRDLCALVEFPRAEAQATSVLNQANYNVPSDMMQMYKFFFKQNGGNLTELEITSINSLAILYGKDWKDMAAGEPERVYFPDSDVYGLIPKPNAANTGTNYIDIVYIPVPATLTSTSTPDLPETFHDTAPFFAAFIAFQKLNNPAQSNAMLNIYNIMVQRLRAQATKKAKGMLKFRWGVSSFNERGS